jgi:hypothetical protein
LAAKRANGGGTRSVNQAGTISETIEHACQVAQRTERKEKTA